MRTALRALGRALGSCNHVCFVNCVPDMCRARAKLEPFLPSQIYALVQLRWQPLSCYSSPAHPLLLFEWVGPKRSKALLKL